MDTYEKKYKEALEKAKALYGSSEPMSGCHVILETLFPELKESEDEKIRKWLIAQLKIKKGDNATLNNMIDKAIAWLEKQGEQKEYTFKSLPRLLDMIEPTSKAKAYCQKLIDTLVKEGYATDAKIVGERLKIMNGEDVPMAIMDEKQGKETTWKPSKEEMDVLYCLAYITNQYDEHKEEVITRLYQDLKREFFNGSSYENMFPTNTSTEDDVRRRSTIQVLEYARSLDTYNQYGKADIDKNIAWLEKQKNCEYIRKDWLEHIKQSWYKEGFIDGKYTPKVWTTNDATTLNELIDFLENGTVKLQHDLTLYANWLKTQFSPNLRILNLTKNKL